jgi:Tfp pilus assembly protein PilX
MSAPSGKEFGMRGPRLSDERGIALAVAIFALVVIGLLVAGTFFAGRLEQQSGENAFYANQAGEAAQAALTQTLQTTSAATLAAIAPGASSSGLSMSLAGHSGGTTTIKGLTSSVWLVTAIGSKTNAGGTQLATRSLAQLVRLNQAEITVGAGLTAIGKVTVSGNSTVSGIDAKPDYWAANGISCPTLGDVAGVKYNGQLAQSGSADLYGSPVKQQDQSLTAANMLGGSTFQQLKALASLTLTSGSISGLAPATSGNPAVCNKAVENNWGAPTDKANACFTYFPIIYHYGDLSISGTGEGQGILLVEGNLQVQGRIDFYGPVIATGGVNIRGTGSDDVKFYGGVMAQDVTLDDSKLTGNAMINYSSCAIKRAVQGSATPMALGERSWVQVY